MIPHLHPHAGDCEHACCLKIEHLSVRIGGGDPRRYQPAHALRPDGRADRAERRGQIHAHPRHSRPARLRGKITFHEASGKQTKLRIGYVPQSPAFDRGDPVSVMDLFTCCIFRRPAFLRPTKAMREKGPRVSGECPRRGAHRQAHRRTVWRRAAAGPARAGARADAEHPDPRRTALPGVDVEGMSLLMDMLDEIRKKI